MIATASLMVKFALVSLIMKKLLLNFVSQENHQYIFPHAWRIEEPEKKTSEKYVCWAKKQLVIINKPPQTMNHKYEISLRPHNKIKLIW